MNLEDLLKNKFLRVIGSISFLAQAYGCENGNDDKQNQKCVDCGDTNIRKNNSSNDTTTPIKYNNLLDPCDPLDIETVCLSQQNVGKCALEDGQYLITKYGDCNDLLTPCYEYEESGYKKAACACTPGTIACDAGSSGKRKCLEAGVEGNHGLFPIWISINCVDEICPKDFSAGGYPEDYCAAKCDDTTGEAICRCVPDEGNPIMKKEYFGFDCEDNYTQTWYACLDDGTIKERSCECAGGSVCSGHHCDVECIK